MIHFTSLEAYKSCFITNESAYRWSSKLSNRSDFSTPVLFCHRFNLERNLFLNSNLKCLLLGKICINSINFIIFTYLTIIFLNFSKHIPVELLKNIFFSFKIIILNTQNTLHNALFVAKKQSYHKNILAYYFYYFPN